jgi:hypothetical protein
MFSSNIFFHRYKTPDQLVHDMLYGTFLGNDATRWGSAHERVACEEYQIVMRSRLTQQDAANFRVEHSGLNVHKQFSEFVLANTTLFSFFMCLALCIGVCVCISVFVYIHVC